MKRVLVVEDDATIRSQLSEYLGKHGLRVTACGSFREGQSIQPKDFDLVIVDWNIGDGDGVDLIKKWRALGYNIPVIMLTARADVVDRVVGLEIGANDYVTKPYDPRELLARVRVHLRDDVQALGANALQAGALKADLISRQTWIDEREETLTKMEFELLIVFMKAAGKVFTRDELLNRVWGFDSAAETRTVDAHVFKLRQKFGEDFIETVRGVGYRMKKPS